MSRRWALAPALQSPLAVVDPTCLLGLALLAGAFLAFRPAATAFAIAATLVAGRGRIRSPLIVFAVLAAAASAWRAGRAVARFDLERAEVRSELGGPARCAGTATVASSPVLLHSTAPNLARAPIEDGIARSPPHDLVPGWDASFTQIECGGRKLARGFRARIYGGPDDLARGDVVEVIATLAPAQLFRNQDLSDPRPGASRRGILASGGAEDIRVTSRAFGLAAAIDRLRTRSRRRIESTFAVDAAPMARALVLGESDLDEDDNQAFRASGLAHLLAVSGTHLVLVVSGAVGALVAALRRVTWASARWDVGRFAAGCGTAFAWAYADFAGGSGSANRAAAMLSLSLAARALGRSAHGPRAFGLSLVGAAVVDPLVAFDISFVLSVAATAGLMVLQPRLVSFLSPAPPVAIDRPPSTTKRAWRWLATPLATTLSATIGCAPIIALMATTLPIGGVAANLIAVPVGELLALPLCLGHVLLGFAPVLERGDAIVASGSLLVVRAIARITQRVTWLALPVPMPSAAQCSLLWATAAALFFGQRRRWIAAGGLALLFLSEMLIRRAEAPRGRLRLSVLDVGQGDAVLVDLPDGAAMLVDGGGLVGSPIDTGRVVIAPTLRARRRTRLAIVALSHPHPDHFGGLPSGLAEVDIGELWDTGQGEREGAGPVYASLLASLRARGVPIVRPSALCGHPRFFGGARVDVLAPCPEPTAFVNPNDNSLVIKVTLGGRSVLLVGDAEHGEEEALVAGAAGSLHADFLKVGHHGSATSSTPAFLAAVAPDVAAISCGVRNRFGHPHPATLRALSVVGRVERTDRDGSIQWETDGASVSLSVAARDPSYFW